MVWERLTDLDRWARYITAGVLGVALAYAAMVLGCCCLLVAERIRARLLSKIKIKKTPATASTVPGHGRLRRSRR